jgi:hypothetical protein
MLERKRERGDIFHLCVGLQKPQRTGVCVVYKLYWAGEYMRGKRAVLLHRAIQVQKIGN